MPDGNKLTWGTYGDEIPIVTPVNRKNEARQTQGGDIIFDKQDIIELKLQEGIDQFFVFGVLKVTDRGKFRIANLMKEGYDYLRIELKSNRSPGGIYGQDGQLMMEILNIEGFEHGHLVGSAYDVHHITIAQFPAYRDLQVWKISKGYANKRIDEIVLDIFDNFLNTMKKYTTNIEDTGESTIEQTNRALESFCVPFWSPAKTLNYLKRYAITPSRRAGYHCWFDLDSHFNFRSLESIMKNGTQHNLKLTDVVVSSIQEAQEEHRQIIKDYYPEFVHKEYYKIGLSGATAERFNWFKKKQYTLKNGYLARPMENGPNVIFEKPDEMNNMFGFHIPVGYRGERQTDLCQALVYNQMLTGIAAQAQTQVVVNGIIGETKMKSGDNIFVENNVQGVNENVEELEGRWFVRNVSHIWNVVPGFPYRQTLALSRIGEFKH